MRFSAMKTGTALAMALVLLALLAASCSVPLTGKQQQVERHREFYNMLPEERHEAFDTYPMEKQFDIYIVDMTTQDPPDTTLADIMASRRLKAVPFLIGKLRQESYPGFSSDPDTIDDIREKTIYIFRSMARHGYYEVPRDPKTIEAIREAIAKMHNPHSRQLSEEYLRDITGGN